MREASSVKLPEQRLQIVVRCRPVREHDVQLLDEDLAQHGPLRLAQPAVVHEGCERPHEPAPQFDGVRLQRTNFRGVEHQQAIEPPSLVLQRLAECRDAGERAIERALLLAQGPRPRGLEDERPRRRRLGHVVVVEQPSVACEHSAG